MNNTIKNIISPKAQPQIIKTDEFESESIFALLEFASS